MTMKCWVAALSSDGGRIVTASTDQTARIWDAAHDQPIAVLSGHDRPRQVSRVLAGRAAHRHRLRRQDRADLGRSHGQIDRHLSGHRDSVLSAAFSSDGRKIVTSSEDGTARIWDAETAKPLATLTGHHAPSAWPVLARRAQGRHRFPGRDGSGLAYGEQHAARRAPELGDFVVDAAYSPDGRCVAVAAAWKPKQCASWTR